MRYVKVGDVIKSTAFEYGKCQTKWVAGNLEADRSTILVGCKGGQVHWVQHLTCNVDGLHYKAEVDRVLHTDADDESRGSAEFVVEYVALEGGGSGHGPHDVFPDGWHVLARRLKADGSYDPQGEVVDFYQTGCFVNVVDSPDFIRTMERTFV